MNPIPAEIWNRGLSYAQYRENQIRDREEDESSDDELYYPEGGD